MSSNYDLVFLGRQGGGKGTQIRRFLDTYPKYKVFEMGLAFRELLKTDIPLAEEIRERYDAGYLMTDEQVMSVFEHAMSNLDPLPKKMIFDGIPRRLGQKTLFAEWMKKNGREFKVLSINIDNDEAISRLQKRRVCTDCGKNFHPSYIQLKCDECMGKLETRRDESYESILKRLAEYEKYTVPVLDRYREEGDLIEIDGTRSIDTVHKEILSKLAL